MKRNLKSGKSFNTSPKRAWRKRRSKLKRAIHRKCNVSDKTLLFYNLDAWVPSFSLWKTESNRAEIGIHVSSTEKTKYPLSIPKIFCLQENPNECLGFLNHVRKSIFELGFTNLFISHEKTQKVGLAASHLFDNLITEAEIYWAKRNKKVILSGRISNTNRQLNNFLLAFGLLKKLNIDASSFNSDYLDFDYENKFHSVAVSGSSYKMDQKGNACTQLVDYFDNCLRHIDFSITETGKSHLVDAFSEIIDNAEEHSGNTRKWTALGCFEKESQRCEFAIINWGRTIYESLSNESSTTKEVLKKLEVIVNQHKDLFRKAGDVFSNRNEEPLWNVMALQEGISCKKEASGLGRTRGQGLMDALQFVRVSGHRRALYPGPVGGGRIGS